MMTTLPPAKEGKCWGLLCDIISDGGQLAFKADSKQMNTEADSVNFNLNN